MALVTMVLPVPLGIFIWLGQSFFRRALIGIIALGDPPDDVGAHAPPAVELGHWLEIITMAVLASHRIVVFVGIKVTIVWMAALTQTILGIVWVPFLDNGHDLFGKVRLWFFLAHT